MLSSGMITPPFLFFLETSLTGCNGRSLVRSQHPSARWNLRGGRWSSVEYRTKKNNKKIKKIKIWENYLLYCIYMCRYWFSLSVINPPNLSKEICQNLCHKCPSQFWWKNPRITILRPQSYRGSQQRHILLAIWRNLIFLRKPSTAGEEDC